MEGYRNPKELNSVILMPLFVTGTMSFPVESFSNLLSPISSSPLFSSIVSFYTLILLYFPNLFLRIVFSPVIIITGILLFTLLRLGATQSQRFLENEVKDNMWRGQPDPAEAINESKENRESQSKSKSKMSEPEQMDLFEENSTWVICRSETQSDSETGCYDSITCFEDSFVEWNVRAPLEIIYEEYEGEEAEEDPDPKWTRDSGIERYPSLSLYYPESDSDDSSDCEFASIGEWCSPESTCFTWDEEDRESLIEIALDHGDKRDLDSGFHVEEENLIEIDISPERNEEFFGEKFRFSDEVRFS
jgi:hypothetical protein